MIAWGSCLFIVGSVVFFLISIPVRELCCRGKLPNHVDTVVALTGVICIVIGAGLILAKGLGIELNLWQP
jgi:hypothetical protein